MLFYTGRRVGGDEAIELGLADALADEDDVLGCAQRLAAQIASSAPLAVVSLRETLRAGLASEVVRATQREAQEQEWQWRTQDFREGIAAMAERREPRFQGR